LHFIFLKFSPYEEHGGIQCQTNCIKDPSYHKSREHFFTRHALTTSCRYKKEMNTTLGYMIPRKGGYETHNAQCGQDFLRKNLNTKYMTIHKDEGAANVHDTLKQVQNK
jgi:hypothetical protein